MSKWFDVITHCWAGQKECEHYAAALSFQLASFQRWSRPSEVRVWVCHAEDEDDMRTKAVIDFYQHNYCDRSGGQPDIVSWPMPLNRLFRRAIGRNEVMEEAANTGSCGCWLIDVEYMVGKSTMQYLSRMYCWTDVMPPVGYVERYDICKTHERGDELLNSFEAIGTSVPVVHDEDFVFTHPRKPIGGTMLVRGDVMKEGYCRGTRRMKTVSPEGGFRRCSCDVTFKKYHKKAGRIWQPLAVPGVKRLRHTVNGRNIALDGTNLGGR